MRSEERAIPRPALQTDAAAIDLCEPLNEPEAESEPAIVFEGSLPAEPLEDVRLLADWNPRPVISHRLRTRVGFPLRGSSAIFRRAIRRSVSSRDSSFAIALSFAYFAAFFRTSFLRRSFLLIELSFAMT